MTATIRESSFILRNFSHFCRALITIVNPTPITHPSVDFYQNHLSQPPSTAQHGSVPPSAPQSTAQPPQPTIQPINPQPHPVPRIPPYAAVVQWIERGPPKSQIQVRFLSGAPGFAWPGRFQSKAWWRYSWVQRCRLASLSETTTASAEAWCDMRCQAGMAMVSPNSHA